MTTVLRPYQQLAVDQIRAHARAGGKGAILHLATGAGKTACFADVLKGAYAKGKHAIMVVRGKALVHQASERLTREGVPHGIYQGENTQGTDQRILVCSVDTLFARQTAPRADLVVIDECHLCKSPSFQWLMEKYAGAFKLGVSATPHHRAGFRDIADFLAYPIRFRELVESGYLASGKYFVPYVPNLRGIKKSNGDFSAKDLSSRSVDDEELTGSAAKIWSAHLRGKSTLVYGVSVAHARVLADALRGEGARCELITAGTKDGLRRDYIRELENGTIDALVSVGVLTTGVDIPSLRAILCCRPTASYNLWVQILGRGTRPFPGKENFLCYDLSGNILQHGPIEAERVANLDGLPDEPKISLKLCPDCYATFESAAICPACGKDVTTVKTRTTGQRIHGLTEKDAVYEYKVEPWEIELPTLVAKAQANGYRKGWLYNMLKSKHGDDAANAAWPRIRAMKKWQIKAKAPVITLA